MKSITILIDGPDVTITTEGFAGKACLKATEGLERDLGLVKKETKTAEYARKGERETERQ